MHGSKPHTRSSFTRRDFVKASAATAAAATLPAWALPMGNERIRVGVIGCGGRGTGAAAQAIQADPAVVITAMGDVFADRVASCHASLLKHFKDRVDVPEERRFAGFDNCEKVIESGVDVVLLCAPPHFRPAHLEASVKAGKHVFCEKPMAVDAPGVRSILASAAQAKAKGLSLVSGFCWRYASPERATYAKILDGAIGEIVSMHTTYHAGPIEPPARKPEWSDMEWQLRNWWHYTWVSGDHIVEQACHSIDKINWAMRGRLPLRATALGGRQARAEEPAGIFGNVFDNFSVIYEYENDVRCFHTCRQIANTPFDNTDHIAGTKGTCFINGWVPQHIIRGETNWTYDGPRPNMYQVEHDELFASIRSGRPINDGQWMAASTMMSILGRMAAYTGQTITWDQAMNSAQSLTPAQYAFRDLPAAPVAVPGVTRFE